MSKQIDINGLKEFKKKCDETYAKVGQGGGIVDLTPYITANDKLLSITFSQEGVNKMNEADVVSVTLDVGDGMSITNYFLPVRLKAGGMNAQILWNIDMDGDVNMLAPQDDPLTYILTIKYIPSELVVQGDRVTLSTATNSPIGNSIFFAKINGKTIVSDSIEQNIELFPQPPQSGNYVLKSRNGVLEWVQE